MNDILFTCSIDDFEVYPKVRMTQRSKWNPRAKRQLENQANMATWFRIHYRGGNKKKEPISFPCILSFAVHLPHKRRIDVDNIQKAIQDALEYGGIVENDCLIRGTDKTRLWQKSKGVSRVCVTLKRLKD